MDHSRVGPGQPGTPNRIYSSSVATTHQPSRPGGRKNKPKAQSKGKSEAQTNDRPARRKGSRVRPRQAPRTAKGPSERALRAAQTLSDRVSNRAVRVRFSFVRREDGSERLPPLARLLRGGRGGEVRLKLLLALLWVAGGGDERHATNAYPARSWAALLDLDDPEGHGQRRVRDAIQWLEREGFVRTDRQPGKPMALQLLLEDGLGKEYVDPAESAKKKKDSKEGLQRSDLYVLLPASFWTEGWAATLSARALAMLLVLREVTFSGEWKWVSPAQARHRYGLSEDTWSKGVAELRAHKIIEIRKRPVSEDDFEFRRVRNTYKLPVDDDHRVLLPARPSASA